jgi:hypothetical protein
VNGRFACFKQTLNTTLREELGVEVFDRWLQAVQAEFEIARKEQAAKNPLVIQKIIDAAKNAGKSSTTIESIVQKILALKPIMEAQ